MKWGIHIKKMVHFKLLNILTFQWIDIFHFLKFHGFKKLKKKQTLWPLFMDGIQLPQD